MTFIATLAWQKNTGQGIKNADGEATFEDVLKKRYPYFDLMQEVWGEKSNIIPPFVAESTEIDLGDYYLDDSGDLRKIESTEVENSPSDTQADDTQADDTRADDTQADDTQADDTRADDTRADDTRADDTQADDIQADDTQGDDRQADDAHTDGSRVSRGNSRAGSSRASRGNSRADGFQANSSNIGLNKASKRLLKNIDKQIVTAKTAYEDLLAQREESSLQKIKVQKTQLEFERFRDSSNLERNKFDFERTKCEAEMELKRKELEIQELHINADKDIRLKEIEIEHLKLANQAK